MLENVIREVLASWGYLAVFTACALEGFGIFFIPGETTLIVAAIGASGVVGQTHLDIVWVLTAAIGGALVGDNFAFLIGREFGFDLLKRHGHAIRLDLKRMKLAQYLFLRYGYPIVFVGRFIMLLRTWESFLAGANAMPWHQFAPVNALAIVVWACVWGLGAWGIGQASENLLEPIIIGVSVVLALLLAGGWVYFHRHEDELQARAEQALPGPLQARRPGSAGAEAAKR